MSFPLVANARLRAAVEQMLLTGRFPHAILIEGEPQTGRHTLARWLARAAVCEEGQKGPCETCPNCRLSAAGNHPDITVVVPEDGKKSITVDQARGLREQAFIRAHMASRRVFLIDRAETLNEQAQNALLKLLEEPPQGVTFILVVSGKTQLLETVVSRCVLLSVSVPSTEEALDYLKQHSKKSEPELRAALSTAGNRLGRALTLLGKKAGNKTDLAAEEFLRLVFTGDEYALLKVLQPFEKNRASAETLFCTLKEEAAGEMRKRLNDKKALALLQELNAELDRSLVLLKTNINLSLLFSALVCSLKTTERRQLW